MTVWLALAACEDPKGSEEPPVKTIEETTIEETTIEEPPVEVAPRVVPLSSGTAADLIDVWVDPDGTVWVVDSAYQVSSLRDGQWTTFSMEGRPVSLWRDSQGTLLAGSYDGMTMRWDGSWVTDVFIPWCILVRIYAFGGTTYGISSYYSGLARYPDGQPEQAEVYVTGGLETVADALAVVDGEVYTLQTANQSIRHFQDGAWDAAESWPVVYQAEVALTDLWSPGPSQLVAVGGNGLVVERQGEDWTETQVGEARLNAVWGADGEGLYAVGDQGTVLYRGEDGAWEALPTENVDWLTAIHGQPGGRIVAVGYGGTVLEILR